MACLRFANVSFEFKEVDTLVGEQTESQYLDVNPTGQVPTITTKSASVIGGYSNYLMFLATHYGENLCRNVYPESCR